MIGFDVSEFGDQKVIVYAIPKVFSKYRVDIELMFNFVWGIHFFPTILKRKGCPCNVLSSEIDGVSLFTLILDEIFGMKACKLSIKAGQRLSIVEMEQLISDAVKYIE